MKRLPKELEDQIQDGKPKPWFCKLHNRPAEKLWGEWRCPECNEYIEKAWAEHKKNRKIFRSVFYIGKIMSHTAQVIIGLICCGVPAGLFFFLLIYVGYRRGRG